MHRYFFIVGRYPSFSFAELKSVLKKFIEEVAFELISKEVIILRASSALNVPFIVNELGGIIKAGEIVDQVDLEKDVTEFEKIFSFENITKKYLTSLSGKVHFGISLYDGSNDTHLLEKLENNLLDLNRTVKDSLKKGGIRCGFVRVKERYLSSVSVVKNGLLRQGVELILILGSSSLFIGKTTVVQDFERFALRDVGRPNLDKRSGILPTKLARIMVNLSEARPESVLLDPFCGSGTIVQEAILLGVSHIFASDKSKRAIQDTKLNIDWFYDRYGNIDKNKSQLKIFESEVSSISKIIPRSSIDRIVTEPYLGPPILRVPEKIFIHTIHREVAPLYLAAFREFEKILKLGGKVLFIFPAFFCEKRWFFLDILKDVDALGFKTESMLTRDEKKMLQIEETGRDGLLYGTSGQFVYREVLKFIKVL